MAKQRAVGGPGPGPTCSLLPASSPPFPLWPLWPCLFETQALDTFHPQPPPAGRQLAQAEPRLSPGSYNPWVSPASCRSRDEVGIVTPLGAASRTHPPLGSPYRLMMPLALHAPWPCPLVAIPCGPASTWAPGAWSLQSPSLFCPVLLCPRDYHTHVADTLPSSSWPQVLFAAPSSFTVSSLGLLSP